MSYSSYSPGLAPEERIDPPMGPRVWAGAVMIVSSLGLIFLAGCFTLGILIMLNPPALAGPLAASAPPVERAPLSPEDIAFMVTLYILTGLCTLAAAVLFVLGLLGLVRALFSKTATS